MTRCRAVVATTGESQAALADGVATLALEMAGIARTGLIAAGDGAAALFRARTVGEAIEAQFGWARRNLDALFGGAERLGEIGTRLAREIARPAPAARR